MRGTRKIDWLNHILEFVVVIIGILIAFQLNTCSQEKKENLLVDRHVENVIAETVLNKDNITGYIAQTEGLIKKADSILAMANDPKNLDQVNELTLQLLNMPYSYIKKNAYNSLIQSGDIRFVDNFSVKDDIINLYEYYDWAEGMNEATEQTFAEYFYPYVMANLDLLQGTTQNAEVYDNREYLNIISSYRYILFAGKRQHQQSLVRMEEFLKSYQKDSLQ